MGKKRFATIALGLAGLSLPVPLQAQEDPDVLVQPQGYAARIKIVDFGDLDIADEQDMQRLRGRIDVAVRWACPARIEGPVRMFSEHRSCREAAWQRAERQLADVTARAAAGERVATKLAVSTGPGASSGN